VVMKGAKGEGKESRRSKKKASAPATAAA